MLWLSLQDRVVSGRLFLGIDKLSIPSTRYYDAERTERSGEPESDRELRESDVPVREEKFVHYFHGC